MPLSIASAIVILSSDLRVSASPLFASCAGNHGRCTTHAPQPPSTGLTEDAAGTNDAELSLHVLLHGGPFTMSVFVTGMTDCASHPDVRRMTECPGVASMWVDVEQRGQGLPGGVFPAEREFDVVIYVLNDLAPWSTQMAAHFAETEFRISAGKRFLLPIDDVLDDDRSVRLLGRMNAYQRISAAEALSLCSKPGQGDG